MLEFFIFLLKTIVAGYGVCVVVALKRWVVNNEKTEPVVFWINVLIFIIIALLGKYYIWM